MDSLLWTMGAICLIIALNIENRELRKFCGTAYLRFSKYKGFVDVLLISACICFAVSIALTIS